MIGLLSWIINPVVSMAPLAAQMEEITEPGRIGIIVMSFIIGPVVLLIIAAVLGAPRKFRIPGLFVGSVIMLIGVMIAFFAAASFLLHFIVPQ